MVQSYRSSPLAARMTKICSEIPASSEPQKWNEAEAGRTRVGPGSFKSRLAGAESAFRKRIISVTHQVIMPDVGQTTEEVKILRWLKQPGEKVAKGEALLEVETDKVTMEVESFKSGYLRKWLVNEGEMAVAMSPIAILSDEPEEALSEPSAKGVGLQANPENHLGSPMSVGAHSSAGRQPSKR